MTLDTKAYRYDLCMGRAWSYALTVPSALIREYDWQFGLKMWAEARKNSKNRNSLSRARHSVIAVLRSENLIERWPLKRVGRLIGVDHSSVIHHAKGRCRCDRINGSAHTDASTITS